MNTISLALSMTQWTILTEGRLAILSCLFSFMLQGLWKKDANVKACLSQDSRLHIGYSQQRSISGWSSQCPNLMLSQLSRLHVRKRAMALKRTDADSALQKSLEPELERDVVRMQTAVSQNRGPFPLA